MPLHSKYADEIDLVLFDKLSLLLSLRPVDDFTNLYRGARPGYPSTMVTRLALLDALAIFKMKPITDIFCLLTDGEYFRYYGEDLIEVYKHHGFAVHRYPIVDFDVPRFEFAYTLVRDLDDTLRAGKVVYIHCSAGMGRTGLVLGCLGEWIRFRDKRKVTPTLTETLNQRNFIIQFRQYLKTVNSKGIK